MRWRDIKKGKVSHKKEETKPSIISASIKDRLKAFLTDTFMITMPIMYIVIYLIMGSREEFKAHMGTGWLYILIPHFIVIVTLWSIKGQTPGMKAYEIKVVNKNLKNPNFFQSSLRYILMPISILSILGVMIAFFRKDRQTMHDLLSGTITIKTEDESDKK
ncbi:RDD family protein [Nitrosophilus labii]|uniref:RDD family protein n=1 Tax=Nitrosophilus labii TaxID=2706014 RepID=UPI0016571527|nr:RDD family protein [Nitrosophilus labii]